MLTSFLSQSDIKHLKKEYRLHVFFVILLALALLLVAVVIVLLPSLYLVWTLERTAVYAEHSVAQSDTTLEVDVAEATLNETNNLLAILELNTTSHPSETIERIVAQRTHGITLSQISFNGGEVGAAVWRVTGFADARSGLIAFNDALDATGLFADIALPIESLARERDISFTLMLTERGVEEEGE